MSKQGIYYLSVAGLLLVSAAVFWGVKSFLKIDPVNVGGSKSGIVESDMIYYCNSVDDFCLNMDKYFAENSIDEKILITKKDILTDPAVLKERDFQASGCDLDDNRIGIPFLYAEGKCYVGEAEVKSFFKKKLGG